MQVGGWGCCDLLSAGQVVALHDERVRTRGLLDHVVQPPGHGHLGLSPRAPARAAVDLYGSGFDQSDG